MDSQKSLDFRNLFFGIITRGLFYIIRYAYLIINIENYFLDKMSRLTKGEKQEIKKLNFEELFFNARKYYNTAEVNFQKVYEFYMM